MNHAVALIVKNDKNKTLFVRRNKHLSYPDTWSLPSVTTAQKDDPNTLKILQEKCLKALNIKPLKIRFIGEKIGNRKTDQLHMQLYLCESFEGQATPTQAPYKDDTHPKYTQLIFRDAESFLSGKTIEKFDLEKGGYCTKCLKNLISS